MVILLKQLFSIGVFFFGACLGVFSKLFDIHTQVLGNLFSEFPIWILLGVLLSIYSRSPKQAAWNLFLFCIGMLPAYYITAEITHSVYGYAYIKGWAVFACICPIFAYFTWMAKEKGIFPIIIRFGIVCVSLFCSIFLFSLDVFDCIIHIVLVYFLFIHKIKRTRSESSA